MATDNIRKTIEAVLAAEGEQVTDDPADSGGLTKWGITQKVASAHGIKDVRTLTREQAYQFYYNLYVVAPGFDAVFAIAPRTAEELVDTGVNCGTSLPSRWLQEWLNAFNNGGLLYPDIGEDGQLGAKTLSALRAFIKLRGSQGDAALAVGLNSDQAVFYKELSRKRQKDERFVYGWVTNRVLEQVRVL